MHKRLCLVQTLAIITCYITQIQSPLFSQDAETEYRVVVTFSDITLQMAVMAIEHNMNVKINIEDGIDVKRKIFLHVKVKDWRMALDLVAVIIGATITSADNGNLSLLKAVGPVNKPTSDMRAPVLTPPTPATPTPADPAPAPTPSPKAP